MTGAARAPWIAAIVGGRPCACVDERSHDLTLAPWTKIDACHSGIKEWYPALVGC